MVRMKVGMDRSLCTVQALRSHVIQNACDDDAHSLSSTLHTTRHHHLPEPQTTGRRRRFSFGNLPSCLEKRSLMGFLYYIRCAVWNVLLPSFSPMEKLRYYIGGVCFRHAFARFVLWPWLVYNVTEYLHQPVDCYTYLNSSKSIADWLNRTDSEASMCVHVTRANDEPYPNVAFQGYHTSPCHSLLHRVTSISPNGFLDNMSRRIPPELFSVMAAHLTFISLFPRVMRPSYIGPLPMVLLLFPYNLAEPASLYCPQCSRIHRDRVILWHLCLACTHLPFSESFCQRQCVAGLRRYGGLLLFTAEPPLI